MMMAPCLDSIYYLITINNADTGIIFPIFITLRGLRFREVKYFSLIVLIIFLIFCILEGFDILGPCGPREGPPGQLVNF